ncbi:MAG: hypothetical protein KJO69_00380 [Gammaproteobacteria bacterium]|nr:hypothetical protein [Gammaproteobacteria bacterium]NNJ73121.1 hypothetical protein [Enterobacterales bacterium]
MINLTEQNNLEPVCPHCEKEINNIWYRELGGLMGKRYVYFCSHCRKTLGVSHRKGFWMG